jgi:1,6-anhydro-N-acetylmuramate kinase
LKKRTLRPTTQNRGGPPAKEKIFIGLISGTSADGIEAALISVPHTRLGNPANVPGITGAKRPVVLGKIVPAS